MQPSAECQRVPGMFSRHWPPPGFGHCRSGTAALADAHGFGGFGAHPSLFVTSSLTSSLFVPSRHFVPAFFGGAGAGDAGEAGEAGGVDAGAAGAAGGADDFRKVSRLSVCSCSFFLI